MMEIVNSGRRRWNSNAARITQAHGELFVFVVVAFLLLMLVDERCYSFNVVPPPPRSRRPASSLSWKQNRRIRERITTTTITKAAEDSDGDDRDVDDDWRAFRAKLVTNEADAGGEASSSASSSSSSSKSSWMYEATNTFNIEKGLLVISRVESSVGCHDLRQPYFNKCVVLIVEHDPDPIDGFTQGLILNRPSNLQLNDEDIIYYNLGEEDDEDDGDDSTTNDNPTTTTTSWPMFFGGDIAGLYDEEPLLVSLHNLSSTSEQAQSVSDEILPGGIYITSHLSARQMVVRSDDNYTISSDDFYTFYGFCGWDPNQLVKEIQRGSWYVVSTDSTTIWNEIRAMKDGSYDPRSVGLSMWQNIMTKINKTDEERGLTVTGDDDIILMNTGYDNFTVSNFADNMLKEWATERLLVARTDETQTFIDDSDIYRALRVIEDNDNDKTQIQPGTVLRGGPLSKEGVSPFLVGQDQFFHKSTILVLQDTNIATIGVVLNLPTTDSYSIPLKDGTIANFIIRYGGPSGGGGDEDDDDDDTRPLVWLHCSRDLKSKGVGISLASGSSDSDDDDVWSCSIDQVIQALNSRWAIPEDFLVVQGFCVWEKEDDDDFDDDESSAPVGEGILGQIMSGKFEIIPLSRTSPVVSDDIPKIQSIFSNLKSQTLLSENTVLSNMKLSEEAWKLGGGSGKENQADETGNLSSQSRFVYDTDVKVSTLADQALLVWMMIYLLGNTEYYI